MRTRADARSRRSVPRALEAVLILGVLALGLLHVSFGMTNFQPGFPKLEGVAAIMAGLALLASPFVARRSLHAALLTVLFGSLPLVAWFSYAVPVQGSSGPQFFWASLVVPATAGLAAVVSRRRSRGSQREVGRPGPV